MFGFYILSVIFVYMSYYDFPGLLFFILIYLTEKSSSYFNSWERPIQLPLIVAGTLLFCRSYKKNKTAQAEHFA